MGTIKKQYLSDNIHCLVMAKLILVIFIALAISSALADPRRGNNKKWGKKKWGPKKWKPKFKKAKDCVTLWTAQKNGEELSAADTTKLDECKAKFDKLKAKIPNGKKPIFDKMKECFKLKKAEQNKEELNAADTTKLAECKAKWDKLKGDKKQDIISVGKCYNVMLRKKFGKVKEEEKDQVEKCTDLF